MSNQKPVNESLFAIIGTNFAILSYSQVIEILERNLREQAATNLSLGPIFRDVQDRFRDWATNSEPGWLCVAPEINVKIMRLAKTAPFATLLSDKAMADAKAQAESEARLTQSNGESNQEFPRIAMP